MTGNDFVKFFLRTLLHGFLGDTMLITVTGRKTSKTYTTPVGFYRDGNCLWVLTSRDRTWWRNLRVNAHVCIKLHGKDLEGLAELIEEEKAVAAHLQDYLRHIPMAARPMGVRMENGQPHPEDAAHLAKERMFVRIAVNSF